LQYQADQIIGSLGSGNIPKNNDTMTPEEISEMILTNLTDYEHERLEESCNNFRDECKEMIEVATLSIDI
jgi:hypothetical protein